MCQAVTLRTFHSSDLPFRDALRPYMQGMGLGSTALGAATTDGAPRSSSQDKILATLKLSAI